MSYKEKSIWLSLLAIVAIWSIYAIDINSLYQSQQLTVDVIHSLLYKLVILTIVLEVIGHIVIAIIDHKNADETADERDKLIALYGYRNGFYILCIGVVAAVFHIIVPTVLNHSPFGLDLPNEYLVLHVIILAGVLAEIVNYSTRLFYYRRGF